VKPKQRRQQKPGSTPPRRRARPSPLLEDSEEHVVPKPLADRVLTGLLVIRPEHEERQVRQYVEIQARPERVTHLEKIKTEHLRTRVMDVWDVRTTGDRYWVVTNPTNLYSQHDFPSVDFTLSFHVSSPKKQRRDRARGKDDSQQHGGGGNKPSAHSTMLTKRKTFRQPE
jgi:hypothetical protein